MNTASYETKLKRYARLLAVHGLNVGVGQFVIIDFEPHAEELALLVCEEAYELGARHVHLAYRNPRVSYAQIMRGPADGRLFYPLHEQLRYEHIVDTQGCFLSLRTGSAPDLFNDVPDRISKHRSAYWQTAGRRFRDEGINKTLVSWCIAFPSSPKAAQQVFPRLSFEEAHQAYSDAIFRMTLCDQEDYLERWKAVDQKLHQRRAKLTALGIREIRFKGPDTNLQVGLSPEAVWMGGTKKTVGGRSFASNMPSYEVFTTPNWPTVEGHAKITQRFDIESVLVEDAHLYFHKGEVVEVHASRGQDAYWKYLRSDEGAKRLGEVALVGLDSPIAREHLPLREKFYGENAACHIATGDGYSYGLKDGAYRTEEELKRLGRNRSSTHLDVMISDEQVDVSATTYGGGEVALLRNGHWVEEYA